MCDLLSIFIEAMAVTLVDVLTLIILAMTLVAVAIYTYVAKCQTDELINQRRLSIMPSLKFHIAKNYFAIKNIGYGPALSINLETFRLKDGTDICSHPEIDSIEPNQERTTYLYDKKTQEEVSVFHLITLGLDTPDAQTVELKFSFQDIEGREYEQTNFQGKVYKQGIVKLKQ